MYLRLGFDGLFFGRLDWRDKDNRIKNRVSQFFRIAHPLDMMFSYQFWVDVVKYFSDIKYHRQFESYIINWFYEVTLKLPNIFVFWKIWKVFDYINSELIRKHYIKLQAGAKFFGNLWHTLISISLSVTLFTWILMIIFTMIYMGKEISKCIHQQWQYFYQYESWLHIATKVSFILTSFHSNPYSWESNPVVISHWQYHVNGFALFLTWLIQMLIIGR